MSVQSRRVKLWGSLRSKDSLSILLLLLLPTVYFGDILAGFQKLYLRDLTRYYYPTKRIIREVVLSGHFPYWNRFYSAGQPMAANPEYEIFYPPQWLIFLPDYDLGYRLHVFFHVYLALIGMYCLLRSMKLSEGPSLFGAITFGLGGVFLSFVNLLPQMFCTAWMPWIFLFARRFLIRPNARDFALASMFLGMQALVGEPMTMAQTGVLVGAYGLYRAWYSPRQIRAVIQNTAMVAGIGVSAVFLAAAQMLPAIDHARDSVRSRPFEFSLVSAWSMPWIRPLELLFPNVLGHISRKNIAWYWGGGLYDGMGSPFIFSVYLGLLALALVVGACFTRPRGGRFLILVAAFAILMALGSHTPLLKALYQSGIASSIRYPEKFALMALVVMTVFAAQMFQQAVSGDRNLIEGVLGFLMGTTIFSGVLAILTFTPLHEKFFVRIWGPSPAWNMKIMLGYSREDWVGAFARGLVLLALFWWLRKREPTKLWVVAAIVFTIVDLTPVTRELVPRMPPHFFTPPPIAREVKGNPRSFRIFHEADWYGTSDVAKAYFSTADAVYWIVRNGMFPMTTATWGFESVLERDYDKTALLPTVDLTDAMWEVKNSGRKNWQGIFAAMSNAAYRTEYRPVEPERKRVRGDMRKSQPVNLIPLPPAPRYYFADQLVRIRDKKEFVEQLSKSAFNRKVGFVHFPAFAPGRGVVERAVETPNEATIHVRAEEKSFLVMSVTPHKYWKATVDGRPAELHIANVGYQGLILSKGAHLVRMQYRNALVPIGVAVSIAGFLIFTLVALFYRVPGPFTVADAAGGVVIATGDPTADGLRASPPDNPAGEKMPVNPATQDRMNRGVDGSVEHR
ncbi:MAG TPA: hypothetical protein VNM92_06750 [Thermoanaerobaculia bacterium]|nr:hypothetical protein [Thermoanaerobaculia bacterium]